MSKFACCCLASKLHADESSIANIKVSLLKTADNSILDETHLKSKYWMEKGPEKVSFQRHKLMSSLMSSEFI